MGLSLQFRRDAELLRRERVYVVAQLSDRPPLLLVLGGEQFDRVADRLDRFDYNNKDFGLPLDRFGVGSARSVARTAVNRVAGRSPCRARYNAVTFHRSRLGSFQESAEGVTGQLRSGHFAVERELADALPLGGGQLHTD